MTPNDYAALLPYATPAQAEYVHALITYGSQRKAAEGMGADVRTLQRGLASLRRRAALQGHPDHVQHVPEGMHLERLHTRLNAAGETVGQTLQARSGLPVDAEPPPEGAQESFRTVLTRPGVNGPEEVLRYTRYERKATPEDFLAALDTAIAAAAMPVHTPELAPAAWRSPELLNVIPIGDPHFGMLSWAAETGENWDLKIASVVHREALTRLCETMPAAHCALLVPMGDNSHINDSTNETPRGRNRLDTDGRVDRVLATLEVAMIDAIDTALRYHPQVEMLVVRGNHDPEMSLALGRILAAYYRSEPRVTINAKPESVHVYTWGPNLLTFIHGHEPKPEMVPGVLAAHHREAIGRTEYGFLYSGHVHSRVLREKDGMRMESVPTLACRDSHAARTGYTSLPSIFGDTYHVSTLGAVERHMQSARDIRKEAQC